MIGYRWILILILVHAGVQSKPELELAHVKPDDDKEYVVAILRDSKSDSARFVFSCRPQIKIRDYHKVEVNHQTARAHSTITCPKYIHVKAITGTFILNDSLNVGLIRKIIEKNKGIIQSK